MYVNCDIYFLDNLFVLLDVNVGDYIFNECIFGMLLDKFWLMVFYKDSYMNVVD